tara:strand:+ start:124 stop:411 length:288 start_codon:yes stop_codon:yes gene_type:complete
MKQTIKKIKGIVSGISDDELKDRISQLETKVDCLQRDISVIYLSCKEKEESTPAQEDEPGLKFNIAQSKDNFVLWLSFILCGISGIAIGWLALNL